MKFTIDRSKWRCGGNGDFESVRGLGDTQLLNREGFMCCLGQVACQLRADPATLLDIPEPCQVNHEGMYGILCEFDSCDSDPDRDCLNTILANQAMGVNDNANIDTAERERQLTNLFTNHGYEIEFTGECLIPDRQQRLALARLQIAAGGG